MTPAEMIEKYIALRNKVAEIKQKHVDQLGPYIAVMQRLEGELLRHLDANKLDSVKADAGTAYKQGATTVAVQDWTQALRFIQDHEAWDLLEARVAKGAALAIVEDTKKPIPGVQISQAVVLRVRAA